MALRNSEIMGWNCTKLRHFFEAKNSKWMIDNLSLENVFALEKKLRSCSGDVSRKIAYLLNMVKHAIAQRDR